MVCIVDYDTTSGECEIQVNVPVWPEPHYPDGTHSSAWVGAVYEMDETVTATWYFIVNFDIDYRLNCGYGSIVTIDVVLRVYSSMAALLQERTAWSDYMEGPPDGWDDIEYDLNNQAEWESFTANLVDGLTYTFAVGLRITTDYRLNQFIMEVEIGTAMT